ncbi:MAG: AMP-binding protein [Burkholderiales bacterium]|nr:AMP-binding protein [Burkholderiales bacterium]
MTALPELELHRWTLPRALDARVVATPDRPFVTTEGEGTQSFAECRAAALAMTGTLRAAGVGGGDFVAVMAPNCRTAIHAWMGANLLGAVDVMINTGYRGSPLEHALNLVQARVLLAEARFLGVLREAESRLEYLKRIVWFCLPDGEEEGRVPAGFSRIELVPLASLPSTPAELRDEPAISSLASVIYTSGTSGPAKGRDDPACAGLRARTADGAGLAPHRARHAVRFSPDVPHRGQVHLALRRAALGRAGCARPAVPRQCWLARIRESGATATLAHGAMLEMVHALPAAPDDADNPLERLMASPFPRRIAADFERRFGVRGVEVWGMTEINNPMLVSARRGAPHRHLRQGEPRLGRRAHRRS